MNHFFVKFISNGKEKNHFVCLLDFTPETKKVNRRNNHGRDIAHTLKNKKEILNF